MFTENPRWAILGNVLEYGGGVGDVRRRDVVVDARRPEQPAVPSLVHCPPACGRISVTPQRTQLYSMAHRTPSSVRVQCSRGTPPPLANRCAYSSRSPSAPRWTYTPPLGSAGVAVGFEGLHDAFQVTFRQSPLVVADDPLGVKLWIGGEQPRAQGVLASERPHAVVDADRL